MPRHIHKAPSREIRLIACAAVAAPWLVVSLVYSLQTIQALWLLRALLLAAVVTLQPQSTCISDKLLSIESKRRPKLPAASPPILPWAFKQPDLFSSSRPRICSRVSTSKSLSNNQWTPKPLSTLSGNTCSHSRAGDTNSSSAGKGNSSSSAPSGTAATTSNQSSGTSSTTAASKSCFSGGGNSGGWDDSDDGGNGGDRPRFQAVKSHSLDAPDSTAIAVAASEETTPANSRTNSSSNGSSSNTPGGSVPSLCDTAPSGEAPLSPTRVLAVSAAAAEDTSSAAALSPLPAAGAAAQATTGPWRLSSPFAAAGTPFDSSSSASSSRSSVAPAAAQQQQQQQQAPAAVTGPRKLASPFAAAPLPAFSGNLDAAAAAADVAAAAKAAKKKAAAVEALSDSKPQQRQPKQYQDAATMRLPKPKPYKPQQQQQQQVASPKGTTGPWALHSPFAAAAAPPTLEVQEAAHAAAAAAPARDSSSQAAAVADPFGSPLPAQFAQELRPAAAVDASSTASAVKDSSRGPTPKREKRERRKSAAAVIAAAAAAPPSPHTGPWGLFSPFAAAVAAEAAPDHAAEQQQGPVGSGSRADHAAAAAAAKADRTGSAGSVRSDRSGSGGYSSSRSAAAAGQNLGQDCNRQITSSRDSSSDRLTDQNAMGPSSVHTASEPRCSLPFSFSSAGASAGAGDANTAALSSNASCALHDAFDTDLQPTPNASMLWCGEGLSPVPSDSELVMSKGDAAAATAAKDGMQQQQQQRVGLVRGGRMHDSAHSHLLPYKPAGAAAAAAVPGSMINPGPAVTVQQQPTLLAAGAPQAFVAPVMVAPAVAPVPAAAAMVPAAAQRSSLDTVVSTGQVAYYMSPPASNAAVQPVSARPARIRTPTPDAAAAAAAAAYAASAAAPDASAAATAAAAAAAARAKNMSCLCCYPPCLTEGQSSDAHVYIAGLDQVAAADAVLRAVVVRGSVIVADMSGMCRPSDGLFRVPIPALPNGPLQLGIFLDKQLCFTQTLLVLPGPSAQEMILLWGSLLHTHLALQQQQQQQQQQQTIRQEGSMEIVSEVIGSGWNSQASSASNASAGGAATAAQPQQQQQWEYPCTEDAAAAAAPQQQQQGSIGGVSSVDVQTVWQKQYTPVLIDIAYLLTAQLQKATASPTTAAVGSPFAAPPSPRAAAFGTAAGGSPRWMAAAAAHSPINMDAPEFKSMVTHLVQFLAANGLWAVLQLITDSVYGVGASAKALYTAKAATSAAASAAASVRGGYDGHRASRSGSGSSADAISKVSQATQVPEGPEGQPAAAVAADVASSSSAAQIDDLAAADPNLGQSLAADPADAVAAAVAAVSAGQSVDLRAVLLLLFLALRNSIVRGLQFSRSEGFVPFLQAAGRVLESSVKQLGFWIVQGLTVLAVGVVWVYESLVRTLNPGANGGEHIGEVVSKSEPSSGQIEAAIESALTSDEAGVMCKEE